jgi:hypothetical protein
MKSTFAFCAKEPATPFEMSFPWCAINLKAAEATPMPAYSVDKLAQLKKEYEFAAKEPSNLRYGYD